MVESTRNIVMTTGFLIGVKKEHLLSAHETFCPGLFESLNKNKDAMAVRCLSILRTTFMKHFKNIDFAIRFDLKNITSIDYFDQDAVKWLMDNDIPVLLINKTASDYITRINELIAKHILNCKDIYPEWLEFDYIKELLVYPGYDTQAKQKKEFKKYMEFINFYPFGMYIHFSPQDCGNILYNDSKFIEFIYAQHKATFNDKNKHTTATVDTLDEIIDFVESGEKTIIAVDCENSNAYKLLGMIKALGVENEESISKIMLFTDEHAYSGWEVLKHFTNIPVEYILVDRVLDRKSIVDINMTSHICREYYKNDVTNFLLMSSDSDYWGMISTMPDAKFLVCVEREKCSGALRATLNEHGLRYCLLDNFCTGYIEDFKNTILKSGLRKALPELCSFNGKELTERLFREAGIIPTEAEINNFFDKQIKKLTLKFNDEGFATLVFD